MDFYDKKVNAKQIIKKVIQQQKRCEIEEVTYIIGDKFGFSRKFVEEELDILEKRGFIKVEDTFVKWIGNK